jgi:hypothetical protein
MVVNTTPSLALIYASLQGRAAHSSTGGPPLDVLASSGHGQPPAQADKSAPRSARQQVDILA